jgi:2-hydroxy-3-keto-5-methylthiopentenyl-1-phosphate phosphatase
MIKDYRLPTAANTRWTKIIQDETPVVGAKYNQYTIVQCVNRGIMGGDAVGEVAKSKTTHVFFVKQDLATAFEAELAKIGTVETV